MEPGDVTASKCHGWLVLGVAVESILELESTGEGSFHYGRVPTLGLHVRCQSLDAHGGDVELTHMSLVTRCVPHEFSSMGKYLVVHTLRLVFSNGNTPLHIMRIATSIRCSSPY